VTTRRWDRFINRFADNAELEFVGVPAGPFIGKPAIAEAYRTNPPDDTIAIDGTPTRSGNTLIVPFRWSRTNAQGTMRLTFADGLLTKLVVSFD
jgi:hypothetical protein